MIDMDEIMKRAQAATDRASRQLNENIEKGKKIAEQMQANTEQAEAEGATWQAQSAARAAEQTASGQQRQVEILGQLFGSEAVSQMAANEAILQRMVDEKVDETAALGVEGMMDRLFGEDMGVIAAALETLAMEEDGGENEGGDWELDLALEQKLYEVLDEKMAQIEALPEPEPIPYAKGDPRWTHFGILLSGIISNLNDHQLDGMDVEEHIPVMEQQIASLVRRSWGVNGRGELLDTIRHLTREGYALRYRLYCGAQSPEILQEEVDGEEERMSVARGWRFAQHYQTRFGPGFLTGWDVGRAAMLARWGCYLGWITEGEATGILWELSQRVVEELHGWREFAQSYLFGGLLWKLLCGDADAENYLGLLADAAIDLLTGKAEEGEGQWGDCPWPGARKIGFAG
ncbi:DUF1266 domain-containing protein [Bittarella massiliensis (ex Durand et al. 2017)]|uniref:DUF1266 domain-containing protein n=1 Tax=Bittarella massiliensis (ex Durand et al. 2017) TaxID=1720313 RepID=UPI001AA0D036|nr:DUF1266 domain-containing protein [Bittarella massiliensis (ex Durand et al. 2017)]MBO1678531.1 DUF1266 domain-containing protein [Bittarella massiliensis (ex Durand et al. 2017)]